MPVGREEREGETDTCCSAHSLLVTLFSISPMLTPALRTCSVAPDAKAAAGWPNQLLFYWSASGLAFVHRADYFVFIRIIALFKSPCHNTTIDYASLVKHMLYSPIHLTDSSLRLCFSGFILYLFSLCRLIGHFRGLNSSGKKSKEFLASSDFHK